ncbi:MAG: c-type cytochrome [Methylophaga sp.]|nr:c-type cytochrome [Methylophaga sp.]
MKKLIITPALSLLLAFSTATIADEPLYTVTNGNEVDEQTFNGFRLHRNFCARCHGTFSEGMAGPNLAHSLNRITKEEFVDTVTNGKMGQIGMMPPWSHVPQVMEGMDAIYSYLRARADGALGEVRPVLAK